MEITSVIIKPKVTEKTQIMRSFDNPKMSFYVNVHANKHQVSKAFEVLFGIKPRCVNVINKKPSPTRVTAKSRNNYTKLFKVAYVTVSSEDFLEMQKKSELQSSIAAPAEEEARVDPVEDTKEGS